MIKQSPLVWLLFSLACATEPYREVQGPPAHPAEHRPVPDTAEDERLAREGGERFEAGDTARALELFRAAYAAGSRDPRVCAGVAYLEAIEGRVDEAALWLERAADAGFDDVSMLRSNPRVAAVSSDPRLARVIERMRSDAERRNREHGVGSGLTRSTPDAEGLDATALRALLDEAHEAHSSALVVLRDGKVVVEEYFGGWSTRIEAMSATKSIVSLAVGIAIEAGKVGSLDTPVHEILPEWRQGKKETITLRHLLNHTSGMQAQAHTAEIYRSPDFVELALAADLEDDPGTRFFYNNKAVNLLPAIVQRATGSRMDEFLHEKLFAPLGIQDVTWTLDRAGNPHGMAGMQIHAIDLAKIGEMLRAGGVWQGRRIVSEAWIAESTQTAQPFLPSCGLLWWLVVDDQKVTLPADLPEELVKRGLDASDASRVADLCGTPRLLTEVRSELAARLGDEGANRFWQRLREAKVNPEMSFTSVAGYRAAGYLGQYLVVLPAQHLVAVRMCTGGPYPEGECEMPNFTERVRALVR